jgi:hypothetical protein
MITIGEIDAACAKLEMPLEELKKLITTVQRRQRAILDDALPEIRRQTKLAAERKSQLREMIEIGKSLFEKPRTHILHGIKVGYRKLEGGVEFDDPDAIVARIHTLFPKRVADLLHVKETPDKDALRSLPAADLMRLGVELRHDSDEIVIKVVDGDVERIVAALLKSAEEVAEKKEAA